MKFRVNVPVKFELEFDIEARNEGEAWNRTMDIIEKGNYGVLVKENIDEWLVHNCLGVEEFVKEA